MKAADLAEDTLSLSPEDLELLAIVAWHYYQDGLTQGEIGDRLGLSRIKVSRLLERGRQTGIIRVSINSPFDTCFRLQDALKERFALADARVIPALEEAPPNDRVAQAAAQHLMRELKEGDLLAIGWGDTVSRALRRMTPLLAERKVGLVSLTGGVSTYLEGIGMRAGEANLHLIPTPLRVSSAGFAAALRAEPFVHDIIELALTARTAIIGIGALSTEATLVRTGYCTKAELEIFRRQGAVGDVLGFFYDRNGAFLPLDLHERVVAVEPGRLRRIETVIGAAAGTDKVEAILGALRGRHVDMLITDETTAAAILREE